MEYIIERNSSTPGFEIEQDSKAAGIREYVNYHVNEEDYKLHSVIPMNNGDHLVIMEPNTKTEYTVYYHEAGTEKLLTEFVTDNMLEQIKLVKEIDSIIIETLEATYECTYHSSKIHVFDTGHTVTGVLDVFFIIENEE